MFPLNQGIGFGLIEKKVIKYLDLNFVPVLVSWSSSGSSRSIPQDSVWSPVSIQYSTGCPLYSMYENLIKYNVHPVAAGAYHRTQYDHLPVYSIVLNVYYIVVWSMKIRHHILDTPVTAGAYHRTQYDHLPVYSIVLNVHYIVCMKIEHNIMYNSK